MARYSDAVQWIADNDDSDLGDPEEGGYIISILLIADLFNKPQYDVYFDIVKRRERDQRN